MLEDTSPLNALELFLALKEEQGLLPATLTAYRRDIGAFLQHVNAASTAQLSEMHLLAWTSAMRKRKLSDGAINTYQRPVWTWLRWLFERRMIDVDLSRLVHKRIVRDQRRRVATPDIHRALITVASHRVENARRDVAIIETLWWTGVRRAEMVTTRYPDDLNLKEGVMRVVGKGQVMRSFALPVAARRAILEYVAAERKDAPGPLWMGRRGPLGRDGIRQLLDSLCELCQDAMPGMRVSSHDFRRACASNLFRDGVAVDVIARQLGHKTLPMSLMYGESGRDEGAINAIHEWDREHRAI